MAVSVLFFIALWIGQGQSQCTLEQLENNLGPTDIEEAGGLVSMGLVVNSQAQGPPVQIFQYQTVCVAADQQRGTYRGASVVVNYTCSAGMGAIPECDTATTDGFVVTQFDLMCNSNWGFNVLGSSLDAITSPADGNLATPQRTTCSFCINPDRSGVTSDQATHCVACHLNCNVGLMLCTGGSMDDCCNYYNDDTCVDECPAPRRPSDDNRCSVFCDSLPQPENGMPIVLSDGNEQGSIANYSCNVGYNLVGSQTRTCVAGQTSTMWTNSEPMCQIVDCRDLNSPTNGQVSLDGGTVFNATATYTCDSTSELTPPDGGTRTCQANGEWTGTAAICKCKSGFKEGDASGVCEKTGLTPGGIAGIVVGVVVGILLLVLVIVLVSIGIYFAISKSNKIDSRAHKKS